MGVLLQIKECLKCKMVIGMDTLNIKPLIYLQHGKSFKNISIVYDDFM